MHLAVLLQTNCNEVKLRIHRRPIRVKNSNLRTLNVNIGRGRDPRDTSLR